MRETKIKLSLGKKIFLSVIVIIAIIISIVYTSSIESISRGLEDEMKIRGISISKSVSSTLSTILSSIIADKISKNPQIEKDLFKSKEVIREILSDLQIKEEYINLIETFSQIPNTEDIIWAAAVDLDNNIIIHSQKDKKFFEKLYLPSNTFENNLIFAFYNTLISNLNVRKLSFTEKVFRNIGIELKVPEKEIINKLSETLLIDKDKSRRILEVSKENLLNNLKSDYEKFSIMFWNIKEIQRKYNSSSFGESFKNQLSKLVEILDYNYITYSISKNYLDAFVDFIEKNKESISREDYNYIISMVNQFIESSFGITGYLQSFSEKLAQKTVSRLLFSYPILIGNDPNKYIGNLYIGMSTESIEKAIAKVERRVQIGVLMALLIAIFIIAFLSSRISKGARIITSAMNELSKGNLNVKVDVKSTDEIGFIANNFNRMVEELAEKEKMKDIMNKVVSEEIAKELMKKGIELGGEMRFTTMLFSDIRGFTSMSEKMDPRDLISILNEYMTEMVEIVKKYKGVVDKFVGDEIMVVYGAPVSFSEKDDALLAVITAYEMIKKMDYLHQKWQAEGKPLLNPGIGINSGNVVAGNMGSKDRLSYTVIGDAVNTAARLCGAAPGKTCIISHNTYSLVKEFIEVEEQESIRVKGKSEPLKIYKLNLVKEQGYIRAQEVISEYLSKI
ncbi:MAG: adenylate/guanylate cyclase domain-containing protein [Brevinematia bacterium]